MVLLALVSSCSAGVEVGEECQRGNPACGMGVPPEPTTTSIARAADEARPVDPVQVTEPLRVELWSPDGRGARIALPCGTTCVELAAVAQGGVPPYAFTWDDGSSEAIRSLCPTDVTTYTVLVADTTSSVVSAAHEPAYASAIVTLDPHACPSSTPDAGITAPEDEPTQALMCSRLSGGPVVQGARGCPTSNRIVFFQPVRAGILHEFFAAGLSLLPKPLLRTVQLWGSHDGCGLEEKLVEFDVTQGPIVERFAFAPHQNYDLLVLDVAQAVADWPPLLDVFLCQ